MLDIFNEMEEEWWTMTIKEITYSWWFEYPNKTPFRKIFELGNQ